MDHNVFAAFSFAAAPHPPRRRSAQPRGHTLTVKVTNLICLAPPASSAVSADALLSTSPPNPTSNREGLPPLWPGHAHSTRSFERKVYRSLASEDDREDGREEYAKRLENEDVVRV